MRRRDCYSAASALLAGSLTLLLTGCDHAPAAMPVTAVLGESASAEGFAKAERGVPIQLPIDHGPHDDYRSEWWYLTIALQDPDGNDVGVQFTVFRQALQPPVRKGPDTDQDSIPETETPTESGCAWCADQAWLGHLALTDAAAERHWHAERLSRGVAALAGARAEPFAVWIDDWQLRSDGDEFAPLRLTAGDTDFSIDLTLEGGSLLLQGDQGYSPKGPDQASHYFSITRLQADGVVVRNGVRSDVTGLGWLDREWSTSVLSAGQRGWDWVSLQLDDGRDLMAFRLRRDDARRDPFDQAVLRSADGQERRFSADEFDLRPTRTWTDQAGNRWPTGFDLEIGGERFSIEAAIQDQLMQTLITYWEGLVIARDANGERVGAGYLELTGYGDGDLQATQRAGGRH